MGFRLLIVLKLYVSGEVRTSSVKLSTLWSKLVRTVAMLLSEQMSPKAVTSAFVYFFLANEAIKL